jgi:hypothetical protein
MPDSPKGETATAFTAAQSALAQGDFAWIAHSALTEKAYWLGVFHGLAAVHPDDELGETAFRHLRDCVAPRAGDDAFADSPFADVLRLLTDAIGDPRAPELETVDVALGTLLAHLAEVQGTRTRALESVHETVSAIQPFTEARTFRSLNATEHARLQELVRSLEQELRVLALVELRWGERLGVGAQGDGNR